MVAYLNQIEGSEDFHQIVDFLNTSHIKYALIENPTIYVSLIKQFWQTAATHTLDTREIEITATIDGKVKIVTEASIRRHLKLKDSNGMHTFPNTNFFEKLALMGTYIAPTLTQKLFSNMRRASKEYTRMDIPLFPTMLVQGLIIQGEGSTIPIESHHTPTGATSTSQPPLSLPSRIPTRQESEFPQPRSPTQTPAADKAASTCMDVRHEGAATTVSSLDVGQGSGNIDKTPSMPYDSPLSRVHTLGSDEGRMQHNELIDLVIKLSDRVVALEIDLRQTKKVYGYAYTKLIKKLKKLERATKSSQTKRKAKIVVFDDEDDTEDSSKQGRKIDEIKQDPDISLVQHDAEQRQERAGYEAAIRLQEQLDEEERQRIARVLKEASSFNIEEWEDIQATIEADEELAQRIQAEEREKYSKAKKARLPTELINQRKRYFTQQRAEERRNKPLIQAQ
ncbi:hypothetical protein Tco_1329158 [Tanacetum coccineum]